MSGWKMKWWKATPEPVVNLPSSRAHQSQSRINWATYSISPRAFWNRRSWSSCIIKSRANKRTRKGSNYSEASCIRTKTLRDIELTDSLLRTKYMSFAQRLAVQTLVKINLKTTMWKQELAGRKAVLVKPPCRQPFKESDKACKWFVPRSFF